MCGGMLYLYSCCSVKLSRIEHNDELKIAIKFNPFYPLEYLINTIPHRRDKEEKKSQNNQPRFEGFQEKKQLIEALFNNIINK